MIRSIAAKATLFACACALLASCATVKERYYFKAQDYYVDPENPDKLQEPVGQPNYYRVDIRARSLFSTSQFAAGWHDKEAVDALFGELLGSGKKVSVDRVDYEGFTPRAADSTELRRPEASTPPNVSEPSPTVGEASDPRPIRTVASSLEGDSAEAGEKAFVLFHASNADAFVNQIRAFVSRRAVQDDLVTLVTNDAAEDASIERARLELDRERVALASEFLRSTARELRSLGSGNADSAEAAALNAARVLVGASGTSQQATGFASREEARSWLSSSGWLFEIGGTQ